MKWPMFLVVAVILMAIGLGGIGGWLGPQLGIEGALARAIGAAAAGAAIAILYFRTIGGRNA